MPQSKESPAAMVCAAERTEVPDDAGNPPPEDREPLLAGVEVTAAPEDAAPADDAGADEAAGTDDAIPDGASTEELKEICGTELNPVPRGNEALAVPAGTELFPAGYIGGLLGIGAGNELPALATLLKAPLGMPLSAPLLTGLPDENGNGGALPGGGGQGGDPPGN